MRDPRQILAEAPMSRAQIIAITLCVLLNALDGFDVLAISFASPGIAAEWGVDRAALGLILSMELIGMAVGSVILGTVADRIGRRPTILGCLIAMAAGMAAAPLASDVVSLSSIRFATGLGIGGMLACTNAMVAEFSNAKNRALAVTIMAAGYPLGAIIGGTISTQLLVSGEWRDVFWFGACATVAFLPLVWFWLPESVSYLSQGRDPGALSRLNAVMKRMGHAALDRLPDIAKDETKASLASLFSPALARTTTLLTIAYFAHIMTFYFILKWIPKIVVDMGYAASSAGGVLVWANVGGLAGALALGVISRKINVRLLVICALLLSTVTVTLFGMTDSGLMQLSILAGVGGFCTNAGVVGLYAIVAQSFPTAVRAGGTGFVIGLGRGGAALGPIIAGAMFAGGFSLPAVAFAMALGSIVGVVALLFLRFKVRA